MVSALGSGRPSEREGSRLANYTIAVKVRISATVTGCVTGRGRGLRGAAAAVGRSFLHLIRTRKNGG